MNLRKSGGNILAHQFFRKKHGFCFRLVHAGKRTEMVASQNDMFHRKIHFVCYVTDIFDKHVRSHAGVAAILVHLVCRCFDERRLSCCFGTLHDCL